MSYTRSTPADIELPPTEPIDISWILGATTMTSSKSERSGV